MAHYHRGELGFPEDTPLGGVDFDRMLREKQARARAMMKKHGLGALLCLTDANVAYVSNAPPIFPGGPAMGGGNRYALLPLEGQAVVFEECNTAFVLKHTLRDVEVEYSIPGFGGPHQASSPEARQYLTRKHAEQILSVLRRHGLEGERVGVDTNNPALLEAYRAVGLDVSLEGAQALEEARSIKTPEELECFRALATIIDGCFATLARSLRPGVTEREVFARCVSYAIENGITPYGGFIVSGPHTWPKDNTRPYSGRRIRPGDVVYADFFNFSFFGYRACCYRTFYVGRAPRELRETYARVYRWLRDAEGALKPGATTRDVVEAWPDERELWGDKPPYIRSELDRLSTYWMNMGHGLGLSLYEPPFFWRPVALEHPQPIHANMAIALETLDCTPDGRMGVRVEDMLVVTDGGCEVLTRWPADEITEVPLV